MENSEVNLATGTPSAAKDDSGTTAGFMCSECSCFFRRLKHLTRHMTEKHNENCERIKCPVEDCDTEMVRRDHLRRHIANVHKLDPAHLLPPTPRGRKPSIYGNSPPMDESGRFKCVIESCEAVISRKDHYYRHIKNTHKVDPREVLGGMHDRDPSGDMSKVHTEYCSPTTTRPSFIRYAPGRPKMETDNTKEPSVDLADVKNNPLRLEEGHPSTLSRNDLNDSPNLGNEPSATKEEPGTSQIKVEAADPNDDEDNREEEEEEFMCILCCYSFYPDERHTESLGSGVKFKKFVSEVFQGQLGEESAKKYLTNLKSMPVCEECFPMINHAVDTKVEVDQVEMEVIRRQMDLLKEIGRLQTKVGEWAQEIRRIEAVVQTTDGERLEGLLSKNARRRGTDEENDKNSFALLVRDGIVSVTSKLELHEKELELKAETLSSVNVRVELERRQSRPKRRKVKIEKLESDVDDEVESKREKWDEDGDIDELEEWMEDSAGISDADFDVNDVSDRESNEEEEELSDEPEEETEPRIKKRRNDSDESEEDSGSEDEPDHQLAKEKKYLKEDDQVTTAAIVPPPPKKRNRPVMMKKVMKPKPTLEAEQGTSSAQPKPKRIKETGRFKCVFDDCETVVSRSDHLRRHIKRVHNIDPGQVISMKKTQMSNLTGPPPVLLAPQSLKKKKEPPAEKPQFEGDHTAWKNSFKRRLLRMIQLRLRRQARKASSNTDPDLVPDPRLQASFQYHRESDVFTVGPVVVKLLQDEGFLECGSCFLREPGNPWHDRVTRTTVSQRMENHIQTAHLSVFQCPECPSILGCYQRYSEHVRGHQGKLKCDICDKQFFGEKGVRRHQWMYHMSEEEIAEALRQGQLDPRRPSQTTSPVVAKKGNHQCDTCGKCFLARCALNVHSHTHEELEDHVCSHCGKVFKWKGSLTYHQKHICFPPGINTPPRLPCVLCTATFKSTVALNNHVLFKHRPIGDRFVGGVYGIPPTQETETHENKPVKETTHFIANRFLNP